LGHRLLRFLLSLAAVAAVTWVGFNVVPVNSTSIGFAYLLIVLVAATLWGFPEALVTAVAATLAFNYWFLPPVGRLTIADPQNWVALFSFLTTALIASRLSAEARRRTLEAVTRQQDLERLYTFSRAVLLIGDAEAFQKQLIRQAAETFELSAAVLYDRRTDEFYRAGPADFDGLEDQLRDAALQGTSFSGVGQGGVIMAVRLGSEPIAGLAFHGPSMPDAVLQGIANLVAIGLERARSQEFAAQVEATRQGEALRTTLLDAVAHEFKTPLTSVMAALSSLRDDPHQPAERTAELVKIADEEAKRLNELIDDSVEMGRLDTADIRVHTEPAAITEIVQEVVASMSNEIEERPVMVTSPDHLSAIPVDRRLIRLAIKQLLSNALKYAPPLSPVKIEVRNGDGVSVAVTDYGTGIPAAEQSRIFERLYRSPSVQKKIPGSGLGLSIAQNIAKAHHGNLSVTSRPGETTFLLTLPAADGTGAP
jgi:two-component system sensor histidine kinase KdpD